MMKPSISFVRRVKHGVRCKHVQPHKKIPIFSMGNALASFRRISYTNIENDREFWRICFNLGKVPIVSLSLAAGAT